jgi:uncharacterized protein (TIGR02145 family)
MSEAWKSKGAISYYGYAFANHSSGPVLNTYAKMWEDTLIMSLVGGDSTGVAHLADNVTPMSHLVNASEPLPVLMQRGIVQRALPPIPLVFSHFFEPNYTYKICGDTLTDARDQQKYPTVCIGNQVWMGKNLNWDGAGVCYDGSSANCDTYGRLYTWEELMDGASASSAAPSGVQGICPAGWHVPSEAEWDTLIAACGGNTLAETRLRSTTGWPAPNQNTDTYGFNMLPGGHYISSGGTSVYQYLGESAKFWTTTASGNDHIALNAYAPTLSLAPYSPPPTYVWKFSCRCVKD